MRLAILITRKSQLPHFEGTIRAAAARGHEVVLLLDGSLRGGPKDAQTPDAASLPARFGQWVSKVREVRGRRDDFLSIPGALWWEKADVVLHTHAPGLGPDVLRGQDWKGVIARLQCDWSTLMDLRSSVIGYDRIYGWTPYWARWWAEWNEWWFAPSSVVTPAEFAKRFVPVGMPLAEQVKWIKPAKASQRFLLYLPFPAQALKWGWWTHGIYDQPWPGLATERAVARRVRQWCDVQGLNMVVKYRDKHPVRPWLARLADQVIGDEPWEPTVLRLLLSGQAAGLVHHLSTACVNAAVAGVWAHCIAPQPPSRIPPYAQRLAMLDFGAAETSTSYYNWRGVSRARTPAEFADSEAIWQYRVNPDSRQQYLERFTGAEPFDTGRRIVEDLEQLVKE